MAEESLSKQFEELEKIAQNFESGDIDLEEGIKEFERGLALAKILRGRLTKIEGEIKKIKEKYPEEEAPKELEEPTA